MSLNYKTYNYCTGCRIKYLKPQRYCTDINGCGQKIRTVPKTHKKMKYQENAYIANEVEN